MWHLILTFSVTRVRNYVTKFGAEDTDRATSDYFIGPMRYFWLFICRFSSKGDTPIQIYSNIIFRNGLLELLDCTELHFVMTQKEQQAVRKEVKSRRRLECPT